MSATNRGQERNPKDYYKTPRECVQGLLAETLYIPWTKASILDPCAGDGVFGNVIGFYYPEATLTAVEIRPEEKEALLSMNETSDVSTYIGGYDHVWWWL